MGRKIPPSWRLFVGVIALAVCAASSQTTETGVERSQALALEQQGRVPEAEAAWQHLAKLRPSGAAEANAHLGLLKAREEKYKEAIAYYDKALALNPKFPGVRMNLGLAYFKSGDLGSAIATFEPLLGSVQKGSQEEARLSALLGLAHYGIGEFPSAVPYLKAAAAADAQNSQLRLYLAQSCLAAKNYECVFDTYREILILDPDSAEADMLAGEGYDELKDESKALEQFQAAVRANPKLPDAHFGCGYLLWRAKKFDEAEAEFKAELANNPDHPLALTYLADSQIHLNRPENAQAYLERAVQLQPGLDLAHVDLGTIYQQLGRSADAERELKAAEKLSPSDSKVHWQLGRFYQSIGRREDANAEFDKTRRLQESADQSLVERLHQQPKPIDTRP